MSAIRKVGAVVAAVVLATPTAAWFLFNRRVQVSADQLVDDLNAAESAVFERPVHRQPTNPGSVAECLEGLLPEFASVSPSLPEEEWRESRDVCLGRVAVQDVSEAASRRLARFAPFRPRVVACLHEAKVAPGRVSRFAEGEPPLASALASIRVQMDLSNCFVVAANLEAGRPDAALDECADAFAFFRDASLMGAGARLGDAASVGSPLVISCGVALDRASRDQRAAFAEQLRAIRAGLPSARKTADFQRLRVSLSTYRPFLPASAVARLPAAIRLNAKDTVSYEPLTTQFATQFGWAESDRLLHEALAEVEKPDSPERRAALQALLRRISKGSMHGYSRALMQIIDEAEARDSIDAVLGLLIAAALVEPGVPGSLPESSTGFSVERSEETVGFRLLLPEPSPVVVLRHRSH